MWRARPSLKTRLPRKTQRVRTYQRCDFRPMRIVPTSVCRRSFKICRVRSNQGSFLSPFRSNHFCCSSFVLGMQSVWLPKGGATSASSDRKKHRRRLLSSLLRVLSPPHTHTHTLKEKIVSRILIGLISGNETLKCRSSLWRRTEGSPATLPRSRSMKGSCVCVCMSYV